MYELAHVVEDLVDTLGFSEHQYIAARHDDKDHEHVHMAINKIHPESLRSHSPAWDHQKLCAIGVLRVNEPDPLITNSPYAGVIS